MTQQRQDKQDHAQAASREQQQNLGSQNQDLQRSGPQAQQASQRSGSTQQGSSNPSAQNQQLGGQSGIGGRAQRSWSDNPMADDDDFELPQASDRPQSDRSQSPQNPQARTQGMRSDNSSPRDSGNSIDSRSDNRDRSQRSGNSSR